MNLEPVREFVLSAARAEADRMLTAARAAARQRLDEARSQADALIAEARAEGESLAQRDVGRRMAEGRRQASEIVLAARRELWDRMHAEVMSALMAMRHEPGYDLLLDELEQTARAQLGPQAMVRRDPPQGGVLARLGNRSVDYTLRAIAERCIDDSDASELWR